MTSVLNRNKVQVSRISEAQIKKREKRKNAISSLLRTSDIVKFIYEYKTLIEEEHTIAMTTKSLKA